MRRPFEFNLYRLSGDALGSGVDATLALMGAQGWELRGITAIPGGEIVLALQRPLDEELPLPDGPTLAATLDEPLTAPDAEDLEALPRGRMAEPAEY